MLIGSLLAAFGEGGVPAHLLVGPPQAVRLGSDCGGSVAPSDTPSWIKGAQAHLCSLAPAAESAGAAQGLGEGVVRADRANW